MVELIQNTIEIPEGDNGQQITRCPLYAPEMSLCSRSTKVRIHSTIKFTMKR